MRDYRIYLRHGFTESAAPQGTGAKGLKMNNAMTRTEAARIVGESTLLQLDRVNCEPTNRVGFNGAIQGDESCEWAASISAQDTKGEQARRALD